MVSLLAGLMMVLLTARTGGKLFGKETGLLAAMLLMCTNGFLHLSHNAQPELLYSAFCTLQLFAWIEAWQADTPSRQKWSALLGWMAAGLATLTKGPQVPAVFLLGMIIFLMAVPDRRRVHKVLRPLSGTLLFCLLVLPWLILLQQRLRTLGVDIADHQLSGSLLSNLAGWKELLSFYYLWMPFRQMLPASLILLLIVPQLIKNRTSMQPSTRLLFYVSITMLVSFTIGGHYRKHYILPLLPVFSIFIANNVRSIRFRGFNEKWRKILCAAGAAGVAVCAGLMIWEGAYVMLALLSGTSFLIVRVLKQELAGTFREQTVFAKQLLVMSAALILLGAGYNAYLPTAPWREAVQEFSKRTGEQLSENDRIVCWKTFVSILPYYARQPIAKLTDQNELISYVTANQSSHAVFAVLPSGELSTFNSLFKTRILLAAVNKRKPAESLIFVEILGFQKKVPDVESHAESAVQ
jgi:4-amino-4-deoxy-L-arabinose transferase-like glycosyltransferase